MITYIMYIHIYIYLYIHICIYIYIYMCICIYPLYPQVRGAAQRLIMSPTLQGLFWDVQDLSGVSSMGFRVLFLFFCLALGSEHIYVLLQGLGCRVCGYMCWEINFVSRSAIPLISQNTNKILGPPWVVKTNFPGSTCPDYTLLVL